MTRDRFYRKVWVGIWRQPIFAKLSTAQQLLFLALLTHEGLRPDGCVETTRQELGERLSWSQALIGKRLKALEAAGLIAGLRVLYFVPENQPYRLEARKILRKCAALVRRVFAEAESRCTYCGTDTGPFEIEHAIPLCRGGTDDESNLTLACRGCNRRKGRKTAREFMASA